MLRENLDDLVENGKVGDWCFVTLKNGDLNLFLRYPVKDDRLGDLPIEEQRGDILRVPVQSSTEMVWQWDGNREAPTLSPSILIRGGDGNGGRKEYWHGFLRNGKIETV